MPRYSRERIRRLIEQSDAAPTADEKGEILEELIRYIFCRIPGVSFHDKNILDGNRAHELDVVLWNLQNRSDICFLDAVIIVECKNTEARVSSKEVGWFVRKLQDRGANYGVLVALSSITGVSDGRSNAHSEVLTALIRDRIKILIITREELLLLSSTDELVELLKNKTLQLVVAKTVV